MSKTVKLSRITAVIAVAATGGAGLLAAAAPAAHAAPALHASHAYTFTTIDNPGDPTFNQLLGINNAGEISGYFGSGAQGHPNQGYTIAAPYTSFTSENFPGAMQTQVVALNNHHDTAGFWVDGRGTNRGFVEWNGVFTSYQASRAPKVAGAVTQILGINDAGIAVGFYNDAAGKSHPFKLNQATGKYTYLSIGGNSQATGINDAGDIVGFTATAGGNIGWLIKGGHTSKFTYPGAGNAQPFGVNSSDEIVGAFTDGGGASHGFTLVSPLNNAQWQQVDDPNGVGATLINGVNKMGQVVGFYTDAAGNVDGFLAN